MKASKKLNGSQQEVGMRRAKVRDRRSDVKVVDDQLGVDESLNAPKARPEEFKVLFSECHLLRIAGNR